jgi:hypothetical protein
LLLQHLLKENRMSTHRFRALAVFLACALAAALTSDARAQGTLPARREEERKLLVREEQIDNELDNIVQTQDQLNEQDKKKALARSQVLNNMRDAIGRRLKDITRDIRETQHKELADMFAGPIDVFLEASQIVSGNTTIVRVTFNGVLWIEDHRFVRLKGENGTVWTLDPAKIAAIRSSPTTQPAPGNL